MKAPSHWTREEFREWLDANLTSETDKKRWILASARLLKGLPVPPGDLLSETILRALSGARNFNRGHPIEANLHEAMRSIASSWHKAHKRKPEISFDDLIGSESDAQDPLEVFLAPDDMQSSPEEELAFKEEMEAILTLFDDREDAQLVVLGRADGLQGKALAEFAGIDQAKLAGVLRVITRRLAEHRRDA